MDIPEGMSKITRHSRPAVNLVRKFLYYTEAKQAFKTGLAASMSFMLGLAFADIFDRPDTLVSGLWSVLTAIVVMQSNLGGTYYEAWIRFFGVLVGSIAGGVFINTIGSDTLSLGISVFCTILICSLLNIKDGFRIAGLSTAIIIILGGLHPSINPWLFSLYRFIDSVIGILVALFISVVFWPAKAVEEIQKNIATILNLMGKYYLMATSLEPRTAAMVKTMDAQFDEINNLFDENRDNRDAAMLELMDKKAMKEHWTLLSEHLEMIFEVVNSILPVQKETLSKIFDDALQKSVIDVIDKTDAAFGKLEKAIRDKETSLSSDELESALKTMASELLRFRATHTTTKFNIEDVESYYVYFYGLRTIGESLLKMTKQINDIPKIL